jgi:leucyl-tRNA synthetase
MREQLKELGLYVDYTKEIDTTDPQYYAITQ